MHQPDKAAEYDRLAEKASPDYVFPFQMEMIAVLEDAMRADPSDCTRSLLSGQPFVRLATSAGAGSLGEIRLAGSGFPCRVSQSRHGLHARGNQRDKALAALEKAVQFGGNAMVFNDLDKFYEENGVAPAKRLALMEAHQAVLIVTTSSRARSISKSSPANPKPRFS